MENRGADYAIGAVQESMMPKQWGCLRFFDGAKIVCSVSGDAAPLPLEIAYKVARCGLVAQARRGGGEIDVSLLEARVSEVQRQLDSLGAVSRALSGAGGSDRWREGGPEEDGVLDQGGSRRGAGPDSACRR